MFRNCRGFTLIETLIAITTLFVCLVIILPSFVLIQTERKELYTELDMIDRLRNELNSPIDHEFQLPFQFLEIINGSEALYHFSIEKKLMKGCVEWETNQTKEKSFCLYKQLD